MHAFDRQTDRQTAFSSLDRVCIARSAVKMVIYLATVLRKNLGSPKIAVIN